MERRTKTWLLLTRKREKANGEEKKLANVEDVSDASSGYSIGDSDSALGGERFNTGAILGDPDPGLAAARNNKRKKTDGAHRGAGLALEGTSASIFGGLSGQLVKKALLVTKTHKKKSKKKEKKQSDADKLTSVLTKILNKAAGDTKDDKKVQKKKKKGRKRRRTLKDGTIVSCSTSSTFSLGGGEPSP